MLNFSWTKSCFSILRKSRFRKRKEETEERKRNENDLKDPFLWLFSLVFIPLIFRSVEHASNDVHLDLEGVQFD